jgi:hypothetical protein
MVGEVDVLTVKLRHLNLQFVFLREKLSNKKHEQEGLIDFDANQNETHRRCQALSLPYHCKYRKIHIPYPILAPCLAGAVNYANFVELFYNRTS